MTPHVRAVLERLCARLTEERDLSQAAMVSTREAALMGRLSPGTTPEQVQTSISAHRTLITMRLEEIAVLTEILTSSPPSPPATPSGGIAVERPQGGGGIHFPRRLYCPRCRFSAPDLGAGVPVHACAQLELLEVLDLVEAPEALARVLNLTIDALDRAVAEGGTPDWGVGLVEDLRQVVRAWDTLPGRNLPSWAPEMGWRITDCNSLADWLDEDGVLDPSGLTLAASSLERARALLTHLEAPCTTT